MSPEQVRGENLDARSDLFSTGVVLYELITGRRAFNAPDIPAIMDLIVSQSPVPLRELDPAVHPELERIVGKALEKNRKLRFQTAADLRADLQRLKRDLDSVEAVTIAPSSAIPCVPIGILANGFAARAADRCCRRRRRGKRTDGDRDRRCSNRTSIAATWERSARSFFQRGEGRCGDCRFRFRFRFQPVPGPVQVQFHYRASPAVPNRVPRRRLSGRKPSWSSRPPSSRRHRPPRFPGRNRSCESRVRRSTPSCSNRHW